MISRVHHCVGQIDVAEGRKEPPAPSCRCRKFISIEKATEFVKLGEVSWVVIGRTRGLAQVVCKLCGGDKSIKNCAECRGKGLAPVPVTWDEYNNDIVLVSQLPEDKTEKKRSSVLKKKTPRVATIEAPHIERAYVYGKKEAQQRIEQYGEMVAWGLQELGAEINISCKYCGLLRGCRCVGDRKTGKVIMEGRPEPKNDAKKGLGRDHDWGRCV
jgi:hypothetical protein